MRLVLDTNVLLAGFFTRGICEALLDECMGSARFDLFTSLHILREFERHARDKFDVPPAEAAGAVGTLREHMTVIEPAAVPATACRDADDLPVLGTAIAAPAECLVTGDKDLLGLKGYQGILIVSPRAFYQGLAT